MYSKSISLLQCRKVQIYTKPRSFKSTDFLPHALILPEAKEFQLFAFVILPRWLSVDMLSIKSRIHDLFDNRLSGARRYFLKSLIFSLMLCIIYRSLHKWGFFSLYICEFMLNFLHSHIYTFTSKIEIRNKK